MSEPSVQSSPWITVIILNYNGQVWVKRCLDSIRGQTIFEQLQVIFADNASTDGSDRLGEELIAAWPNGLFMQNGANIGFGAGTNHAVERAHGKYLFFLNPDVWLEPECLEKLYHATERATVGASGPVVLNYDDDTIQTRGGIGFDMCGIPIPPRRDRVPSILFAACGFSLIRTELFRRIGGFDDEFFLYGEEADLSWRVWLAGEKIIHVPEARMHHRGGAATNPKGGTKIVELRTSDAKRFYANRNTLLVLLKNCHDLLLLLLIPCAVLLLAQGILGALLVRRFSFFRTTYLAAIADCWRLRGHIAAERRRINAFRKRSDFWMLRFFTLRLALWIEVAQILRLGLPKVEPGEAPKTDSRTKR